MSLISNVNEMIIFNYKKNKITNKFTTLYMGAENNEFLSRGLGGDRSRRKHIRSHSTHGENIN